jgi:hypothetical protein
MGSRFDDCVYWHFFTMTINYYSSQLILTTEGSLHSTSRSTTDRKRRPLSSINSRYGPRTENMLRTPYPTISSIVIETAILLLLPALPRECV